MKPSRILPVLLSAGVIFLLWRQDWPRYRRLQENGAAAQGWVTAKGLGGHRLVNYSYTVESKLHSGIGPAGFGTADYDEIEPDDDVIVYYLPSDPDVSSLGDPEEHLRAQNRIIILLLIASAPVFWLALRRELRSQ